MRKADGRLTSCRRSRTSHERRRAQQSARDCAQNLVQKQQRKILELQEELARFSAQPLIDQLEDRLNCIRAELQYLDLPEHPPPEVKLRRNVAAHSKSELLDGKKVSELSLRQLRSVQKGLAVGPADADFGHNDECDSPHHYASCDIEEDTGLITDFAEQYSTSPLDFFTGFAEEHGWPFYSLTVGTIWAFCYWVVYYTLLLYIILSCFNVGNFFVLCYWVLLLGVYLTNTYSMASTHGRGSAFDELIEDSDSYTVQDHGHLDECVSPHRCANNESEEDIGRHVFTDSAEENLETERLGKEKNGNFVVTLRPACLNLTLHDEEVKDGALEDNPGSLHDLHGYALHGKKDMDENVHERLGKEKNGNFVVTLRPARWKNSTSSLDSSTDCTEEKEADGLPVLGNEDSLHGGMYFSTGILEENSAFSREADDDQTPTLGKPLGRWRQGRRQKQSFVCDSPHLLPPGDSNISLPSSGVSGTEVFEDPYRDGSSRNFGDGKNSISHISLVDYTNGGIGWGPTKDVGSMHVYDGPFLRRSDSHFDSSMCEVPFFDEKPDDKKKIQRWADVLDSGNEEDTADEDSLDDSDNGKESVVLDSAAGTHHPIGPSFCSSSTSRILEKVITLHAEARNADKFSPCHFDLTLLDSPGNLYTIPATPPGIFDFGTRRGFGVKNLLALPDDDTVHEDGDVRIDSTQGLEALAEDSAPANVVGQDDEVAHDLKEDKGFGMKYHPFPDEAAQPGREDRTEQGFIYRIVEQGAWRECTSIDTIRSLANFTVRQAIRAAQASVVRCEWKQLFHLWRDDATLWRSRAHAERDRLRDERSTSQAIIDTWSNKCDNLLDDVVFHVQGLFGTLGISRTQDELLENDIDVVFNELNDQCAAIITENRELAESQIKIRNLQALNNRLMKEIKRVKSAASENRGHLPTVFEGEATHTSQKEALEDELQMCLDNDDEPRFQPSYGEYITDQFESDYFAALQNSLSVDGFAAAWLDESFADPQHQHQREDSEFDLALHNESNENVQISRDSAGPRKTRRGGKGRKEKRARQERKRLEKLDGCAESPSCAPPYRLESCKPFGQMHSTPSRGSNCAPDTEQLSLQQMRQRKDLEKSCGSAELPSSAPSYYFEPCKPIGQMHSTPSGGSSCAPHFDQIDPQQNWLRDEKAGVYVASTELEESIEHFEDSLFTCERIDDSISMLQRLALGFAPDS